MSILAYQEVICRIEELTRCIHELDPYSVMPPPTEEDPAATLAMLVSSGERARQQRRGRSPERRALQPPPPRLARSPAWAPGGTTYAEIVKGCNSRSSSVHERQPSVQRLPMHRMRYETPEMRQTEPVNIEPEEVYNTAIISDVQQCARSEDFVDKSEPIDYHESTYYESECDVPVASDTNVYCEQKPVIDIHINKKPSVINQKHFQEESVSHLPQDTHNTSTLRPSSIKERSVSPATKYRCQDLSYAEILALGLRKQTSVQNVTILPKPQTAQVEIVTEVVIEEEKMSQNESKLLKDASLAKQERLEKPVQRSRSRDMPRQRRAPEKRKTPDIQLTKKKKGAKKVIEVENFDDICDSMPTEEVPRSSYKTNIEKPKIIEKPHLENPEGISVVFKNESVVETEKNKTLVKDTITADEEKKPKKKSKTRKPKESEDDIERALKEIEQSDKQKKKKLKQKMKENDGECLTETVCIKTETISSSQIIKKSDSTIKPKKKKIKEVPLLDPITTSFTDRKEISEQHNDDSTKFNSVKTNASTNPNESNPVSMIQDVIYNTTVNIEPEDKTDEKHLTSSISADSSLNYTCTNQSSQKDILSMSENIKSKKKKKDKKQEPPKDSNLQKSGTEIVPSHIKPPVTSIQRNIIIENNRNICKVEENSLVVEDNQENLTDNSNIIESPIERDDNKTNQNESEKDDNNASGCDAATPTKVDVSNIDWVKLMEEEEQISLTGNKDSVGCKEIQEVVEQRNNEVLKVLNNANVDETNQDTHVTKLCRQNSDLNLVQTSSNEQNNNDISNEIKEDSAQITTEINVTENYFPNEKTHTVYLITHEEKKLPPIRTVKVFRSKSNSLEEHPISDVDTLNSQLLSEIEELSSYTRPEFVPAHQGTASEAAEHKNVEVVEDILLSSTTSATNVGDLEKNDDNVEQAIFGSVQIRKKNISESNIPYTELIDDNNIVIESEANIKDTEKPSVLYLREENSRFSYFELHDAEKRLYSTRAQNDNLYVNVTAEDIKTDTDLSKGCLKTGNQLTENVTDSQLDCSQQDKNLRISTERVLFEQPYYNYAAIVDAERLYANNVKYHDLEIPLETCNAQSASSQTDLLLKELRKDISLEESDKKISSEDQHSSLKKHPMIDVKEVPQQNYQDIADAEHLLGCVTNKQEANFVDKDLKESKENINGQTKSNVAYEVSKLNYQVIEDAERLLGSLTSSKQNLNSPPFVSEYTVSQKSDNVDDDKSKVICNDEIPRFNYQEICDAEKLLSICNRRDYDSSIEINTKEAEVLSKSNKVPQFEIPIHNYQELIDAEKLQAIQNNKNEDKLMLPLEQLNKAEANRKISKIETDIIKDSNLTIKVIDILQKDSPTQHHSEIANVISENVESMQRAESSSSYENIDKPVQLTEPSVESNQQITDVQNESIIEAMSDKEDDGFVLVEISDSQDQIINDDNILESNYIEPVRDTTEVAHEIIKVVSEPLSKEPTYQLQSQTASSKIQITTNVSDVHQSEDFLKVSVLHQEAANDYVIVSESEKVPSTNEVIESNIEDKTDLLCNLNVTADSSTTVKDLAELTSEEQNIITRCSSFNIEKQITTTDATVVNLTETLLTKEDVSNEESANDYEIINQVENIESINQINIRAQKSESEDKIDSLPSTTSLNPEFSIEPENVVTYDKNEMSATRTEKSPIHSLHDLLPEIDSIPEFKPSYNNKALFSNLSADAPEFKPSYLYHTTETTTFLPEISNTDSVINTSEGNTISILTDSKQHSVKSQQEISDEKVNTAIVNIVSDSPQTSDCKTASDAVSKVETKKRKKADKPSSSHKSEVLPDINISATPVNVWTKAADEGKSYAKIVAEGLSEFPKIEKKIEERVKSKTEDSQCEIPLPPPKEEISIEAHKHKETSETWAKIVASHLPSPDRLSKVDISVQEVTPIPHKSPIIVVEGTENVECKSDVAVDAEGFITVDRNRRSRSRSRTRDINSPSVSKTPLRTEAREKSINRFDALVDNIISDDTSDIPNIESNEEKVRKKERESPEKSVDSKDKNVSASHKKRDKSKGSSSQLSSKKTDTTQKSESNQKEMSVSIVSVEKSNVFSTDSQKETQSKKKKNKKKNKDKTVVQSLVDTTTKEEVSVAKDPDIELKVQEEQIQKLISPIGTPESIQTPVKERVYSEAQFWKTSPDIYLELSSASEVISVEVPECSIGTIKDKLISVEDDSNIEISNITHCEESETSMMQDIKLSDTKISEEQSLESNTTNIESEISSMTHHEEPEANKMQKTTYTDTKISEEQSLENKMADLQREIEEMLLPENDNSTISEDLPNELMDLDNSINEHQDELLDNMSPSLASPEPEDTLGSQEEIPQFDSMPLPHKKYDSLMAEQGVTLVSCKKDNTLDTKDQLLSSPGNSNESLTYDEYVTNNLSNLLQDSFSFRNFAVEDAENLYAIQKSAAPHTVIDSPIVTVDDNILKEDQTLRMEKNEITDKFIESLKSEKQNDNINKNIFNDQTFWCDKHLYHDAECLYVTSLMNKSKPSSSKNIDEKSKDQSDRDRDPNGSGYSSESEKDTFSSLEPSFDSNYISMDLPGGICSWQDQSSYLSLETPSDLMEANVDLSRLDTDISEDTLTNLPLHPVTLSIPIQEPSAEEDGLQKAKDNISNELETLLDEVKIVQASLTDLPNESLQAMERGLEEGISILVKCEEAAILLEQKIMEYRQETEIQALIKELVVIKTRITKLLSQARQGIAVIQEAKSDMEKQKEQIEKETQKIAKLDHWLETINNDLNETAKQSNALVEEDIIKYITIYERYLIEYNEYEIILKSITVINCDDSSQLEKKLIMTRETLEETKHLVISELERLKQLLTQIKSGTETIEEELSQSDRTIDSTSMPEEIVSPREIEEVSEEIKPDQETTTKEKEEKEIAQSYKILEVTTSHNLQTANIETQTGKSLAIDSISIADKSIMCQPNVIDTQNVAISCIPLQDVEIQTSDNSQNKHTNLLENLQIRQTNTENEQTIEISSKPIPSRSQILDENMVVVNADYKDGDNYRTSKLDISHTIPQSFETIMVEPDETTTEVVVDADGTKRIIVKKIKRSMVTRQHLVYSQNEPIFFDTQNPSQQFSQITLASDKGIVSDADANSKQIQYESYGSHIISGVPDSEVVIQEVTSKPDTIISLEKDLKPDEIFKIAEGQMQPVIETSSSSVTAVVQQVTKRIVKTKRRIIRRVIIVDGKEQVSEEIVEEPDDIEITEEQIPRVSITVRDDKTKEDLESTHNDDNSPQILSVTTPKAETSHTDDEKKSSTVVQQQENIVHDNQKTEPNSEKKSTVIESQFDADMIITPKEVEPTEIRSSIHDTDSSHLTELSKHAIENLSSFDNGTNIQAKVVSSKRQVIRHVKIIDGKEHVTEEIIDQPSTTEILEVPMLALEGKFEIDHTKLPLNSTAQFQVSTEYQRQSIPESLIKTSNVTDIVDNFLASERVVGDSDNKSPKEISNFDLTSNLDRKQVEFIGADTTHIQQMTRTMSRTRKRIIQHINIVDGKEHITEEVIEEPEEIEVIKEDPVITQSTASQFSTDDYQGKRLKIIRQIKVVDGKEHVTEKIIDETGDEPIILSSVGDKVEETGNTERPMYTDETDSPKIEIADEYSVQGSETLPVVLSQLQKSNVQLINTNILTSQKVTRKITTTKRRIVKHITIVDGKEHVTEEVIEEPDSVEIVEVPSETENIKVKRVRVVRQVEIIDGKEQVTEKVVEESDDDESPCQVSIQEIKNVEKDITSIDPTKHENIYTNKEITKTVESKDNIKATEEMSSKEGVDDIKEATVISDMSMSDYIKKTNVDSNVYKGDNIAYPEENKSSETSTKKNKRSKKVKRTVEKREEFTDPNIAKTESKDIIIDDTIKPDILLEAEPSNLITESNEMLKKPKDENITQYPIKLPELHADELQDSVVSTKPLIVSDLFTTESRTEDPKINKSETKVNKDDNNIILSFIDNEKAHSETLILQSPSKPIPEEKYTQSEIKSTVQTKKDKAEDNSDKRREEFTDPNIAETVSKDIIIDDTIKPDILLEAKPSNLITESNEMLEKAKDENITQHSIKLPELHADELQDSVVSTKPVIASDLFATESKTEDHKINKSETKVNKEDDNIILSFIDNEKAHSETLILQSPSKPKEKYTQSDIKPTVQTKKDNNNSDKIEHIVKPETTIDDSVCTEAENLNVINTSPEVCGNISALIRPYSEKSHEKETENKNSPKYEEDLNNVSKNIVEDIPTTNEPENEETNLDQKIPLEIDETLHVTGTSDLVLKTGIAENIIIESDVYRKTANIDPNLKLDTQTLLEMERQNTNPRYTSEKLNDGIMKCQTVDISMSLAKANENVEPKVQIDLKIEDIGDQKPVIVKKDINIDLPVSVKVSETKSESDNLTKDSKLEYTSDDSSHKKTKKRKKSKKNQDESQSSNSQNIEPIAQSTADNTFVDSDSSSLSHYVELPTPTPEDSLKPKGDVTVEPILEESRQEDSLSLESKPRETEKGYEADDTSIDVEVLPIDKKGKHKKRKSHGESEDTAYPKTTTSESETSKSPVDIKEPQNKDKKSKKGKKKHLPEDPIKQHESTENVTSPKDESCHTFSDTSEVNTVKIVEECVNSSPEIIAKDNVTATLTYPVPVLEEVQIQELSSQTSPELIESKNKENDTNTHVKLVDSELQTSPTPTIETLSQTLPIDDKENSTQTSEDFTVIQTRELLNSEVQTSRIQTPDPIVTSEVMTQIESKDIIPYDDKFSQTATTKEFESEVRETQTSPISNVTYDEKYTEIIIPTADSGTETEKHENVDQQTTTSPSDIEIAEISVQTNNIPLVSTHTQSETVDENIVPSPLTNSQIQEIIIAERSQQTSPIESSVSDIKFESAKMIDSEQQTTPRKDTSHNLNENITKENVTLVSNTQQTSPRLLQQSENILEFIKHNIDQNQQTSPRELYEETTSTSTDEPYEVQLRAQISIPQASIDFIKNERESEELSDSIIGDSHKQKRRRQKKKTESPLKSPGSLSDPLNTELSLSVSPTSDDLSSKDISSIDEGISQHASPISHSHRDDKNLALAKLSYSDVVQRSKSKSPSPSKTILTQKSGKAKLLDALEKRTKSTIQTPNISDDTMTVALFEPSVEKSYDLIINKELDVVKNALKANDSTQVESSVIVIIETISIWLEEIQCKIQTNTLSGIRTQDESVRIKTLETYIKNLKEIITVTEIRTEIREEIITLIETLTRQVYAVNNLSHQRNEKVQELENNWNKFISDIDRLYKSIHNVKSSLDNLIMTETTTQQKLEYLDKIETENVENMVIVKKMFNIYKNIIESNHKKECPTRLYTCDDCSRQIENSINTERDRLLQLASLAEEYEQTLQDFRQITDVAEALLDGKIIISNLDHLHEEIQKHRKFFVNLSHCRAILESLEDNLDSETRAKYSSLHHSLHDRATAIIDRAASRAQQMTLAASRWRLLDQGMKEEQQWLRVAQQRIPDATNVTSMDYEQYINLYQSISLDVSQHYAKMLRLISITEGLQGLVTCSGLETDCSLALDTLLKLQEEVDSSLTRLIAFKENWSAYDHLVDRIEGWIKLGNRELETITPENITTTANLRRFWELKAQHEVHNNLKTESGVQFEKALEILPISDEMVQRQFFSNIEDKWRALSQRIGDLHAAAIQNISDRDVSTGEKLYILEDEIRELRSVLDSLKGVIKSDDELNLYIERLQVMSGRIDRIQNELGRLSLLPTAESERLGALLTQSGMLSDQFAEELERSLLLKEKILQVKAGIARCQKSQRRAKLILEECEAGERLGSDVVERASQTCDKLVEDLSLQWKDILALRQALHTLPTSLRVSVSPLSVERDISALQETHSELESACTDLSVRLRARLQLWRRFERQLELVQGAVREADYMVELLTVQGQVDYDRLLKATEKLETLSESLTRRNGELVGSLRSAAEPLQASCEASVAAQLQRELDDAAATYEHTCANLTTLCDKYQKAVELWKRYRDAAAVVRAFAEQQEGSLHALRPDDAPAMAEACLEQEARVAELRSLAARVAAETGSRALQTDADALARRLQLVAGAVQALADLGEARQLARAKAQHAKEKFCDMRQDLTPVHEEGEIVEDKLIALRDNLIALGKSEADIAPAKAELPDIDRDVSDEHSIVRILELWQAMFRDTFLHYHRLSTALVRSGDAATALKLWHEYLLDLQSFLSGSVPADYENLTEHRRLCRVHRNLLASQRSVLINENKESKNQNLTDKFDTLTNLHNETLARIVERHDEVCTRIATWDDYRSVYTEILQWLKEIEREKEKLQLRYVHIKRIHKTLNKIQNLSDKLPEGRKRLEKLFSNLKKVLIFTEETYGASVRMEYAGIVKRVENLQASLDTWRDFLTRILGLIGEYDNLTSDLQKLYNKSQLEISNYSDDERLSRPQLKKALDRYTELRAKINKTETRLEGLSVIQEQLKECLSPQDIRIVNQKVWQLRQQQADLEHQLSIIIHKIQERLEIYSIFDTRLTRFTEWITKHETRLETCSSSGEVALDPQDLLRRINSDIQAETSLKEREFEWLTQTGSVLIDLSKKDEKSYSKNTSKQLKDVQERWHKLQDTGRSRVTKINELLETIVQLEETLTEIRLKLHTIESQLSTTVVLEQLTTKAVDSKFQARDEIHKCIETESEVVGKNLNLCELVLNDPDVIKGNFDLRNLHTGVDIVDKKWKNICDMSEHRKNTLKEIRKSAELANSLLPKVEKKLDSIEKRVEKIETRKQRGETEDESVSKAVTKDLDNLDGDIKRLEDAYSRIASARGVELRGAAADDAARLRSAVRKHQQLKGRVDAAGADAHRRFIAAHGKAVVALAEADVRLTRALHLAPMPLDKVATLKELDGVERDLAECDALVQEAERLAGGAAAAGGAVSDMRAEYRALYADVRTRLGVARADVVGDVDTAVQVDTLRWETDAELQVDTLTSKETYRVELTTAVQETSEALEALRTILAYEIKDNTSGDELATAAKEVAKAGAKPGQTLELAKHLSELLLTECDATEDEAMLKEVESLSLRYEELLNQAKKRELQINNLRLPHSASYALTCEHESGKITCPLCSDRNWKQLDNDLWRLEQWLQYAEATDEARTDPPEDYDALEDAITDHREFLLDLDSHKSLVVSLNVVGSHVTRHARDADAAARAQARLTAANARWDAACARAGAWQTRLQEALVHSRQFHDAVVALVAQLASAERLVRAREPLRLARPAADLRRDFRRFSELRDELSRAEPRVLALRDAAHLLRATDEHDLYTRLGELRLRLQSLRKLSAVYALKLGAALARAPPDCRPASALAAVAAAAAPQLMEEEEEQISTMNLPPLDENDVMPEDSEEQSLSGVRRGLRFVCRVARASLPFQALLLLLLGAAALAPTSHDCRAPPSLAPVLRYPHGPPPL